MPGILPMKVIKVGTSSQSRIAQACDRCRSKKIRCDGIRPCCSQCANVGFECRTSDKLSRRAFPRGYTESLEERVRQLESEVRELKDLLDEKDEKIDMLSKMHGNQRRASVSRNNALSPTNSSATSASPSPTNASSVSDRLSRQSTSVSSASPGSTTSTGAAKSASPRNSTDGNAAAPVSKRDPKSSATPAVKEDTFRVQASPLVLGVENSDSYYMGSSSGRSFIGMSFITYCRLSLFLVNSFLFDTRYRHLQEENTGGWQVLLGLPCRGVPAHPRLLPASGESSRVEYSCSTASVLRPVCQRLLPGMVTPLPYFAPPCFPAHLRRIC
jgi:hypothetical protein